MIISGDDKSFFLINKKTNKAMEGKEDGDAKLTFLNIGKPEQRWVHTTGGNLFNMATGLPLNTKNGNGRVWRFGDNGRIAELMYKDGRYLKANKPLENNEDYDLTLGFYNSNDLAFQFEKIMSDNLNDINDLPKLIIKSELDNRVLEMVDGKVKMHSLESSDANQLWHLVETEKGFMMVNVGTGNVLIIQGIPYWQYNEETKFVEDAAGSGKILRRAKKQEDGAPVGATDSNSPTVSQLPERCMFNFEPVH